MRFLCKEASPLNDSLKVLSIGCGPCSELFPLDEVMAKQFEEYCIDFVGIDMSDKWRLFHAEIDRLITVHQKPIKTRFIIGDVMSELNQLLDEEFDIIVLNYFLSDYRKLHNRSILPVRQFSHLLYNTVINRMPINSYILLNDINHNESRDCFDALIHEIKRKMIVKKFRFRKPEVVLDKYTQYYNSRGNPIINIPKKYLAQSFQQLYSPRTDCSSAQIIVEVR
jgi:aryl-phospho-beta-D-glucosidase BglC (GH1 family)